MKLTDLRGILRYIPQYRDKVFIIAVDGAVVAEENFPNLVTDIAILRSLNIRVVLVHGASAQIDQMAREKAVVPSNLDGSGVTDEMTLQLALNAANRLTHEILKRFLPMTCAPQPPMPSRLILPAFSKASIICTPARRMPAG